MADEKPPALCEEQRGEAVCALTEDVSAEADRRRDEAAQLQGLQASLERVRQLEAMLASEKERGMRMRTVACDSEE